MGFHLGDILVDEPFELDRTVESPVCRFDIINGLGFISAVVLFRGPGSVIGGLDGAGYFSAREERLLESSPQRIVAEYRG